MKIQILTALTGIVLASAGAHAAEIAREPVLTYAQAKAVLAKAEDAIKAHHIGGAVAVEDAGGHLITFDRLDGSTLANVELAPQKAHTAVAFGVPSSAFQERITKGSTFVLGNPAAVPLAGGIPLKIDGHVVGAIGVSTPVADDDEPAALAGASALDSAH